MVFNKDFPQNSTKIRNAPTGISTNWNDIVNGDNSFVPRAVNFFDRTTIVPIDPAPIATTPIMYCKQDSAGRQQLYAENPSAVIEQITRFADLTPADTGNSWLPGNIQVKWGRHTTTNTVSQTVTFAPAFTAAPYIVIPVIQVPTGSTRIFCNMQSVSNTQFIANTQDQLKNPPGAGQTMYWIAIGK